MFDNNVYFEAPVFLLQDITEHLNQPILLSLVTIFPKKKRSHLLFTSKKKKKEEYFYPQITQCPKNNLRI